MKQEAWWVYILECSDGSLYTGATNDINKRQQKHNQGKGAKYTAGRRPVSLVYFERHADRSSALKREYQLKQLSRDQKTEMVDSFFTS